MAPLIALGAVSIACRLLGLLGVSVLNSWSVSLAIGLAAMFALTSTAHFFQPKRRGLIAIVPRLLPWPAALVTLTGVLEVAGAIGLLIPASRAWAAGCLSLLLVLMFPANIRAARRDHGPDAPHTPLIPRTLYQLIFLAATLFVAVNS